MTLFEVWLELAGRKRPVLRRAETPEQAVEEVSAEFRGWTVLSVARQADRWVPA